MEEKVGLVSTVSNKSVWKPKCRKSLGWADTEDKEQGQM